MEETQEQAVPNNGASNAADFQPPTQSPQTAPGADVQKQNGLEGVTNTQEFFNENKTAEISVTTQPAPAQAKVKNDPTGLVIVLIIATVVVLVVYKIFNRMNKKDETEKESKEAATDHEVNEQNEKPDKSIAKKKPAKKAKRRNR